MKDWFLFISLLYLFDSLRGFIFFIVSRTGYPVFTLYALRLEQALFKPVPSVYLQHAWLQNNQNYNWGWFEKFLTVLYGSHFFVFFLIGFLIWVRKNALFTLYKKSFYFLISCGLLTYLLIPTAPPWMAANLFGLIPSLIRFNFIIYNITIPDITSAFNLNPVAAMPSLHAAFPFLCFLLLWKAFNQKAWPFLIYIIFLIFGLIYSGDHYFIDIILGILLAWLVFLITSNFQGKQKWRCRLPLLSSGCQTGGTEATFNMKKNIILGLIIIAISFGLGMVAYIEQVAIGPENLLFYPKYIDFVKNPKAYNNNILVQVYLARYYLLHKEPFKALPFFERAHDLTEDNKVREQISLIIKEIRERKSSPLIK